MKLKVILLSCLLALLVSGCATDRLPKAPDLPSMSDLPSVANLPFIYKVNVQQGNVITQDMLAQLQLGMDKKKVNFVMGSPIIMDTFHSNRWDYLYTNSTDGGRQRRRRVTLFFENDVLVRVEGDVKPATGQLVADTRQDMTVVVPKPEKKSVVGKVVEAIPFVGEEEPKARKPRKDPGAAADDDAPPPAREAPPPPEMTPIQRAKKEEQGGPGVLTKLKDAMPFTGEDEDEIADALDEETEDQELEEELETEEVDEADALAEEEEDDAEEEPGVMERLTGVLPFVGEDEETDDEETADEEATDEPEVLEEDVPTDAEPDGALASEPEEEAGPGMMERLTGALPFMGDDEEEIEEDDSEAETPDAVVETIPLEPAVPPAATEEEDPEEPGMLDRLSRVLPFLGDDDSESELEDDEEPADARDPEDAAREDEKGWDWEKRYEDVEVVTAPPPGSPTAQPLENELRAEEESPEEETDSAQDPPAEEAEDDEEEEEDEPGFFDRIFGD